MKRIFIHIPKTGGQTIQRTKLLKNIIVHFNHTNLISKEYVADLRRTFNKYKLNYQYEHCRWRDLDRQFRSKYQAFAIVRNPWSKVVSSYLFAKKINKEHPKNVNPMTVFQDTTFEQYLECRHKWGNVPYFWHRTTVGWYPQFDHVTDTDGTLKCDILRFEHHDEDTKKYFNLSESIEKRNVSNVHKKDYRTFYTAETRKAIGDWYKKDIDFFGFTFDGPATRNIWNG